MASLVKFPRATQTSLATAAAANELVPYSLYWITDLSQFALALTVSTYQLLPKLGGQQLLDAGTAALPTYSFSADPDSGLYRDGADTVAIAAGGLKVFDIGPWGGYFWAKPSSDCDFGLVSGTGRYAPSLMFYGNGGSGFMGSITGKSTAANTGLYYNVVGGGHEFRFNGATKLTIGANGLALVASTTTTSNFNIPHGVAPTTPVNGDVWTTTAGMYVHINGTTIGPLSTGGGGLTPDGDGDLVIGSTRSIVNIVDTDNNNADGTGFSGTARFEWRRNNAAKGTATLIGVMDENGNLDLDGYQGAKSEIGVWGAAGSTRRIGWYTQPGVGQASSATMLWEFEASGAQSGSNAGANMAFSSYSDAGTLIGQVFTVNRASRVLDFKVAPTVNGAAIGSNPVAVVFHINGGGAAIAAGQTVDLPSMPFAGTIQRWTITSDVSTTSVVTVSKATFANFPTMTAISGTEKPSLSAAQKAEDTSLTTWTTAVAQGDILRASVDSNNNAKTLSITLWVLRT